MKTFIATILMFMATTVNAAVIETSLSTIRSMLATGELVQLTIDGVEVAGARYSDQMETISTDLGINIYGSVDTEFVLWFAPRNGAGSVLDRLK